MPKTGNQKPMNSGINNSYQIITDATVDINIEMLNGLPPLEIIPMDVQIASKNYSYGPHGDLDINEFYRLLREGNFAGTCQISPFVYTETFETYLTQNKDVLYLSFSSGMSGTYASACMAAKELNDSYPNKVICIDTLDASVGLGLLTINALTKQKEGQSIEQVALWAKNQRLSIAHRFTIDTFDHLKHGGRVSSQTAAIGTLLQVKPLLRINEEGKLVVMEKPKGHKKAISAFLSHVLQKINPSMSKELLIGHCDNLEDAKLLKKSINECLPDYNTYITDIGPIIGCHTGPGMLAVAYYSTLR